MGSLVAELAEKLSSATNSIDFDEQTLFINTSTNRVAIGTNAPVTDLTIEGPITIKEQADADADTAAYGQIWVNTATPNELYFTTDAGDDIQLTTGTSLAFIADGAQTWNESGAAVDFRIESDDDTHIFFVDGSEDRIGIGVSDPDGLLEVVQTKSTGYGLHVQRDLTAGSTDSALVYFHQDHGDDDQVALHVRQDGDTYAIKINSYTGSSGDIYSEGQSAGKWTTLNTGTTPYNRFSFQALKSGASAVDDNDILFDIIASGYGGTAYRNASSIKFFEGTNKYCEITKD